MRAGFYDTDITPAMGALVPGWFFKRFASGVRDPLKARAAVLDSGRGPVALVGIDTCGLGERTVCLIREAAERKTAGKVRGGQILVAASHTHSGGMLSGYHPDDVKDAPPLIRTLVLEHSLCLDLDYERLVVERASDAVYLALARMDAVTASVGSGEESAVSFCRRVKMKDGRIFTHPGKGNPDIAGPASTPDPEVGVIGGWRADGALAGCVVNFACHGTAWQKTVISADWIAAMERTIRGVYGPQAVVVFLNGASGDVATVDNLSLREMRTPEENLVLIGTRVGAEAVKVLALAERGDLSPVMSVSRTLELARRRLSPEKVRWARDAAQRLIGDPAGRETNEFVRAKDWLYCDYLLSREPHKTVEIQAVQVGPAVFLGNPSEYFCSLGLKIKRAVRERFPFAYVVELANGKAGYVPDSEAFGPGGGGYETRLSSSTNLEPAAGDKIAESSIALAATLEPGRVPQGPQIEKPGTPWPYGNQPPELD